MREAIASPIHVSQPEFDATRHFTRQRRLNPNISLKKSATVISGPRLLVYDEYTRYRLRGYSL
jgi:hypothetical protein